MKKTGSKILVNLLGNYVDAIGYGCNGMISLFLNYGFNSETLYEITQILAKRNMEFEVFEHNVSCTLEIQA